MKTIILTLFTLLSGMAYAQPSDLAMAETNPEGMARVPHEEEEEYNSAAFMKMREIKHFIEANFENKSERALYVSCNDDSMYYEQDTIKIHQLHKNYYPNIECCRFIEWGMISDSKFIWTDLSTCNQNYDKSYYLSPTIINVIENNNDIFIKIVRNEKVVDTFKIIGLEEKPSRYHKTTNKTLLLTRVKTVRKS
ncbi:hypothetical protein LVD15_17220 [Fulvivirga maritima]|uniref:hypothetical protein n=1 Tax=Fulvivirga maritima TaxID=2904247 RepID=UPI001F2EC54B|nr:hypothetical protein [Fulvivirga maritima]UII25042.1 hypothetical protein LVD15_17220 [Fulvivirga maritima]